MKKVFERIGIGILVLLGLVGGFMFIGPRFGWETYPVLSGSMAPALPVGSQIVTRPVKLEDIKIGDIITFESGEHKVTHRVIAISLIDGKPWFQTKGDANEQPDPNLVSSEVGVMRKVVFRVPYFGYFHGYASNILTTPLPLTLWGRPIPVGFVVFMLLVGAVAWFSISWINKKWQG
jgi:signal peptidase